MSQIYVGRRKCSVALVCFVKGNGDFIINEKTGFNYFQQDPFAIQTVVAPLKLINLEKKYNIVCLVRGGGICAQAEAIRLGIARALCSLDSNNSLFPTKQDPNMSTKWTSSESTLTKEKDSITKPVLEQNTNITQELTNEPSDGKSTSQNEKSPEKNSVRSLLKEQGFLRRDSRIKERRKYGLKKARKAEQYSKR